MATLDKAKQVDNLIRKLEQASQESASGNKSWDGYREFLANFETLAELHDPKDTDVANLTKRKHICYHIADMIATSDQKDARMIEDILSRIERLILSDIFPSETDFCILVDWLDQLTLLFESTWPRGDAPEEPLDHASTISKNLISFCAKRLRHENLTDQTELNYCCFKKTCSIAKQGLSPKDGPTVSYTAVEVLRELADIINEQKFVEAAGEDLISRISEELWSIAREDLRDMAKRCFACDYKMDKSGLESIQELYDEILHTISILPASNAALEFFSTELSARSRPESDAVDLAILNRIVIRTPGLTSHGLWSILDIHIGRGDPKLKTECLKTARGRFGGDGDDEIIEAMLKHLYLIVNDMMFEETKVCRDVQISLVELLCSILLESSIMRRLEIDGHLFKVLRYIPVEHLTEDIICPIMQSCIGIRINMFASKAVERFQQIYRAGVETRDHVVALESLYNLIVMKGDEEENLAFTKYIDIVAAGCRGSAPKGCNKVMFRVLNETKALLKEDNQMFLLPLARAVYDQDES